MISTDKWQQLRDKMQALGIDENDLREQFILGSGSGGQKIHKTASCVLLRHLPSQLQVRCQQSRSREANRFYARRRLCEKFQEQVLKEKSDRQQAIEKKRRQKRRRSRKAKEKILGEKKQRAKVKQQRKPPSQDDG